jgi:hypothetical protein
MLKKDITYTDYDGNTVTETFYFHLNKAEIAEKEINTEGGYAAMLEQVSKTKNGAEIMKLFKEFILMSYGIKSEDGKHFRKSEELRRDFEQSEAYSELFIQLCTDANAAAAFISGIFPFTDAQRKEFMDKATTTALPSET